jgi:hypothetical protein
MRERERCGKGRCDLSVELRIGAKEGERPVPLDHEVLPELVKVYGRRTSLWGTSCCLCLPRRAKVVNYFRCPPLAGELVEMRVRSRKQKR